MTDPAPTYDEFSLFHENAEEAGLPFDGPPVVRRESRGGRPGPPGQRAGVGRGAARARPPPRRRPERPHLGHGGPGPRPTAAGRRPARPRSLGLAAGLGLARPGVDGRRRGPGRRAVRPRRPGRRRDVARRRHAIALATRHPHLVRRLVLVDITPGVNGDKTSDIAAFLSGPETFATFDEILRADHPVQPDPVGVVAAPRRPPQLGPAARRHLGLAPPAGPAAGRHRAPRRAGRLPGAVGRARSHPGPGAAGPGQPVAGGGRRRRRRVPPAPARRRGGRGRRRRAQHPGRQAAGTGGDHRGVRRAVSSSSRTRRMFVCCSLRVHFPFRWPGYGRGQAGGTAATPGSVRPTGTTNTEDRTPDDNHERHPPRSRTPGALARRPRSGRAPPCCPPAAPPRRSSTTTTTAPPGGTLAVQQRRRSWPPT